MAEWTSVPEAQVEDTITVEGRAEAKLSDGSLRAADSAHVLWRDSLIHRAEDQQIVETEVFVPSQAEDALVLRAFASGKEDEATRSVAVSNPITGAEARWLSVPSVAADTIVAEGRAEARRSDGSTEAADSAHVLWRGETVRRVSAQKEIQVRVAAGREGEGELALRAFASIREDEATETVGVDATPPELTISAEDGSDYGTAQARTESNEDLSRLEVYLLNGDRTDSIQVASRSEVQEVSVDVEALSFYQPGDTARFSAHGEDKAGNVASATARGVVEGVDVEVEILRVSSAPDGGLVPQEATLTVVDSLEGTQKLQTKTDALGQAVLENLAIGDTIKANDNPGEEAIGDLYETHALVESEEDAETTMGMLPNIDLQSGDETYEHSLDLLFQAQRFGEAEQNPSVLTIPPHNISPDYEEPTEEIYPMTFAINQNGRILQGEHRQALEDGVRSWNGPNGNYQHATIIEDTTQADWTIRITNKSEGLKREQRAIEVGEPTVTSPPEAVQQESAHYAYHALELGTFAHLDSPRYIGSTSFGDDRFPSGATRTEVEVLHSLINLRTIYDSGRNLEELYDPE